MQAAPVLISLDSDAADEIVVGSTTDTLWIIDGDGSEIATFDAQADIKNSVGVGDVDFDGDLEIVVAAGDSVFCLDGSDLARDWGAYVGGTRTSVSLADLKDGDGKLEAVVGSYHVTGGGRAQDCVSVLEHDDGDTLWERLLESEANSSRSSPAIADVDQDGLLDVVVASGSTQGNCRSKLYAFKGKDGALLWSVYLGAQSPGEESLCSAVIGDIDDDHVMEVVVGSDQIYARRGTNGNAEWSYDSWGSIGGLALEDVDDDGKLEIIATAFGTADTSHSRAGEVYVIEHDGTKKCSKVISEAPRTAPCVIDLDSDGDWEIVFGADDDTTGHLYAYSVTSGGTLAVYDMTSIGGRTRSSPAVGNVDTDSYAEIFLGASNGRIYGVESQDTPGDARWTMFQKNERHTGRYQQVFSDTIPEDVSWWDEYLLNGDVTVPDATTLLVQPSTDVIAAAETDLMSSGADTSRTELIVDGTLLAEATNSTRIRFLATADSARSWYGIRFRRDSAGTLNYCDVNDAYTAVKICSTGSSRLLKNVRIDDSYMYGIRCAATDTASAIISSCRITSSVRKDGAGYAGTAVYVDWGSAVIESTTIRDYGEHGVTLYENGGNTRIRHNRISPSAAYGPESDLLVNRPRAGPRISYNELYGPTGISWNGRTSVGDTATCQIWCNTIGDSTASTTGRGLDFTCGRGGAVRSNEIRDKYILIAVYSQQRGVYPDCGDTTVSWGNNNLLDPTGSGYCFYNFDPG